MSLPLNRRQTLRQLSALGAACATPWAWGQSGGRLVLGQSAPLTGPAAELGLQMNRGARLYFDALNANGGVNGMRIDLRVLDDGYEPTRCKANTE